MAQGQEPMTDEETEEFRQQMEAKREDIRADLADKLGGEPEDYNTERVISEATSGVGDSDE
ncbi:MAG: hypothetical protein J07HN4v3_01508 [Halonotius sp. J07HN4]|nr:MAG: hypothetical protein J07HN4v3_01508 [Halonotius sp. J07HN4]